MSTVQIKGLLEFNNEVVGVRALTTEYQRFYDIDKDILLPEVQTKLPNASYPRILLVVNGDKLVSKEEQNVQDTIATVEARLDIVLEVERVLLGSHQKDSNPQPLLRDEQPTQPKTLTEFMVTIESKEFNPIKSQFELKQFTGSFHTPSKAEAERQAKLYYAMELDTNKDEIKVVHVDTEAEYKQRQATKSQAKDSHSTQPVESNKSQESATAPQPTPQNTKPKAKENAKEKSSAKTNKPKADKPEPKKKTKQYTVLLSVKSLTPDGTTVEDREIKRDFEDVNLVNVKAKAREEIAKEYNVSLQDVKVLKAGVKK